MTKYEFKRELKLAIRLSKQLSDTLLNIQNGLNSNNENDAIIEYWFDKICSFERVDIDEVMSDFETEGCFDE